jgi:hypothetical protein
MHGNGVAQTNVLAQVLILEDGAGPVIETLGGDAISGRVDDGHPPSVAVADRIRLAGTAVGVV